MALAGIESLLGAPKLPPAESLHARPALILVAGEFWVFWVFWVLGTSIHHFFRAQEVV